jgi:hypothetical protein
MKTLTAKDAKYGFIQLIDPCQGRAGNRPDAHGSASPRGVRKQILLHLEADLIKVLKKAAVDLDTTASVITNEAVDNWLRAMGFALTTTDSELGD